MRDPIALTQRLLAYDTTTPADLPAFEDLQEILNDCGFTCHLMTFSEPGTYDVVNLYARRGTAEPCLLLAGHLDVVPPGPLSDWRFPPFSGVAEDGALHGRGVEDMKGALAAFITAAEKAFLDVADPKGSIAFLITGDEERKAVNGLRKALRWAEERGEKFACCLLGEPTSRAHVGDVLKIGRRGSLTGRLLVHGEQGHVAYPEQARNPIEPMMRLLTALKVAPFDAGRGLFPPSNLEITTVDVGNSATNVIPGRCAVTFNVRFNDLWTSHSLASHIRALLAQAQVTSPYDLSFDAPASEAFLTEAPRFLESVRRIVSDATAREVSFSTSGGTSDARFIKDFCPVVELGLVGKTLHKVDENVPIADLKFLAELYEKIICCFLKGVFHVS